MTKIGGIVLCGGRSSRMGKPKAWLPFGDELMLQRVVRILSEAVDSVVVVAAKDQKIPELPADVTIVRDEYENRGPLQGLATGLKAMRGRTEFAYLSSCDVPFLSAGFVQRIISFISKLDPTTRMEIAVPRIENRFHPLAAVYRKSVLPTVLQLLAANQLRLNDLIAKLSTRAIEPHELADIDPEFESLSNLNTWGEYDAALQLLRTRQQK
jgi:molybdopterin-guanine dinucleotide biosynthesis protein A